MNVDSGFTLVELLIVLTIGSILAMLAIPGFDALIADNRMVSRVNSFVGLSNYARGEAVSRSDRVTLCPSSDGTTCLTTGIWESGWIVFVDADDSGTQTAGDTILQVHEGLTGNAVTVRGSSHVRNYISYIGNGLIRQVDGRLQSGTMVFCDDRGAGEARTVTINSMGRLTTSVGAVACMP